MTTSDKKEDRIYPLPRREDEKERKAEQIDPITTGVVDEGNFGLGVGLPGFDEGDQFTDPVKNLKEAREDRHSNKEQDLNREKFHGQELHRQEFHREDFPREAETEERIDHPHDAETRITNDSLEEVNQRATEDFDLDFFQRARNNFEELPLEKADPQRLNSTLRDFAQEDDHDNNLK
ncbi:hypothetical protein F9B85_08455 [Heliorestis acidaminivorans]|uniref:Uncharacterized protein n=1 Tax=Heliorestis acidaminivorans TaxID=553427 RepID=A0A6I0F0R8_9FIRM|nr:hypothetical protein [Heliorestis acidaminivorans]KAB2952674.1 hypothetical protein F9B85_08455 [Heliorestis acidaminivorans]